MKDYQKKISEILGSVASSAKVTGECQACGDQNGHDRLYKGEDVGILCHRCWAAYMIGAEKQWLTVDGNEVITRDELE